MRNCSLRTQDAWYTSESYPLVLPHPGTAKEYFKGRVDEGDGPRSGKESKFNRSTLSALEKIPLEVPLTSEIDQ